MKDEIHAKLTGFIGKVCIIQALVAGIVWGWAGVVATAIVLIILVMYLGAVSRQGIGVSLFSILSLAFWLFIMVGGLFLADVFCENHRIEASTPASTEPVDNDPYSRFVAIGRESNSGDVIITDPKSLPNRVLDCLTGSNGYWKTFGSIAAGLGMLLLAGKLTRRVR